MNHARFALPFSLLVLAACSKTDNPPVHAGSDPSVATQLKDKGKELYADFKRASSDKLDSVETAIADLKAKAAASKEAHQPEIDQIVADLRQKKDELAKKLAEIGDASQEKWQSVKAELEPKIAALQKSAQDALAKFK